MNLVYKFSKLFGLCSYTLAVQNGVILFIFTKLDCICLSFQGLFFILQICEFMNYFTEVYHSSPIEKLILKIQIIEMHIGISLTIFYCHLFRKRINDVFHSLNRLDQSMQKLEICSKYNFMYKQGIWILILINAASFICSLLDIYNNVVKIDICIMFFIYNEMTIGLTSFSCLILLDAKTKLLDLNSELKDILNKSCFKCFEQNYIEKRVANLLVLYKNLTIHCANINSIMDLVLLLNMANLYIMLVVTLYYTIILIGHVYHRDPFVTFVIYAWIWVFYYGLVTWIPIVIINSIDKQVNITCATTFLYAMIAPLCLHTGYRIVKNGDFENGHGH